MAIGQAPPPDTEEVLRRVQVQVIDHAFESTFLKTVHRIAVPTGGGLSVVRKRRFPLREQRGVAVLVHGFGQNRYSWHTTHRSFVNYLAFRGWDVFNLELRGFGRSRHFGTTLPDHPDVHFEVDVPRAIEAVSHLAGAQRVFLIGHSLGGACCYAAAPLVPDRVAGVVTIAGLYRFASVPGWLAIWSTVAGRLDRVGRHSSISLPVNRLGRIFRGVQRIMDSRPYRLVPLQAWFPGTISPNVLAEVNRNSYDRVSLGVTLALATWGRLGRVTDRFGDDRLAAFDALDLPLMVIAGSHDVLMPPSGAKPAFVRSASRDKTFHVFGPEAGGHHWGHVDLILGDDAPAYVWPTVADWLDDRA